MESFTLLEENIALKKENQEMQATISKLSNNINLLEEEKRQLQLQIENVSVKKEDPGAQLKENSPSLRAMQNHTTNEYDFEINKLFLLKIQNLSAEIFRKILGILNKLTPENFDILIDEIMKLQIDTRDVHGVVTLVFEKAINEPFFSELYARLCHRLAEKNFLCEADSENQEMRSNLSKKGSFKSVLLDKMENEFSKHVIDVKAKEIKLKSNRERLMKCTDPQIRSEILSQLEEQEYELRQRSYGIVRFIGELFKISMITGNIIEECVISLLDAKSEEKLECLCKLLRTVGKELEQTLTNISKRTHLHSLEDVINKMQAIVDKKIEGGKISNRIRFMLQDIIDLRINSWTVSNIDLQRKMSDLSQQDEPRSKMSVKKPDMQFRNPRNRNANTRRPKMPITEPDMQFENQGDPDVSNTPPSQVAIKDPDTQSHNRRYRNANRRRPKMSNTDSDIQFDNQEMPNVSNTPSSQVAIKDPDTQSRNRRYRNANKRRPKMSITDSDMQIDNQEKPNVSNTPRYQVSIKDPADTQSRNRRYRNANRRRPTMSITDPDMQFDNQERSNVSNTLRSQVPIKDPDTQFRNRRNCNGNTRRPKMPIKDPDMQSDNWRNRNDNLFTEKDTGRSDEVLVKQTSKDASIVDTNNLGEISNTEKTVKLGDSSHSWLLAYNIFSEFLHLSETKLSTTILSVSIFDFIKEGDLNQVDMMRGYSEFCKVASEVIIDTPNVWSNFFEFIGPLTHKNIFQIDFFWNDQLRDNMAGKKFLRSMFTYFTENHGINYTKDLWKNSKFNWQDFLQDNEIQDSIEENQLQLINLNTPTCSNDSDQKETIDRIEELLKKGADVDEVTDYLCKSNKSTCEKSFIYQITKTLCEHSLQKVNENYTLKKEIFQKTCVPLLQRYIDSNEEFELECLKAIQGFVEDLEYPTELLFTIFTELLDSKAISRETFLKWWSTCEKTTNINVLERFFNAFASDPSDEIDNI